MRRIWAMALLGTVAWIFVPANAADIIWIHQMRGQEGEGTGVAPGAGQGTLLWEDDPWRELLVGAGHNVVTADMFDDLDVAPEKLDELNAVDLVIFSRDSNSGDYNTPDEQAAWTEGITVPMIILSPYVLRNNRWDMMMSNGITDALEPLEAVDPAHPVFKDVPLDASKQVDVWDETLLGPDDNIDVITELDAGNGTILAVEAFTENPWIIYWEKGVEFYEGSLYTAGGPRLYFAAGSDDDPYSWGEKNTTPAGDKILLNAIDWLVPDVGLIGDFNNNDQLDAGDLDLLAEAQVMGNPALDLTNDGKTDLDDRTHWVNDLKRTWMGDSNLDGEFSSSDFVAVFQAGKFETGQPAGWAEGDWNGDQRFDTADFVLAFQAGGFEKGPRPPAAAVPEPAGLAGLLVALFACFVSRRK